MPTQEERLTTVEYGLKQFKTETIKAYQEVALELTMVKGLCEDAVKRLMTLRTALDQHMTEVRQDVHQLQTHMTEVRQDVHQLQTHMTEVRQDVHQLQTQVEQRFNHTETLLTQILARLPEKR